MFFFEYPKSGKTTKTSVATYMKYIFVAASYQNNFSCCNATHDKVVFLVVKQLTIKTSFLLLILKNSLSKQRKSFLFGFYLLCEGVKCKMGKKRECDPFSLTHIIESLDTFYCLFSDFCGGFL
jgi:hypothetical protein